MGKKVLHRLSPGFATNSPASLRARGGDFRLTEMTLLRSAYLLYSGRMTPTDSKGVSGTKPSVRIAVDMDEVIADYFGEQVARYESWSGTALDISGTEGKKLRECVPPEHREFVSRLPRTPGFFANLKMIEGSRDALQILSQHTRIYIVSAATEYPNSLREKFDWLAANFPFIDWRQVVLCGDKSIIRAEYMIDDNIQHLRRFEGEKILFDSPHNRKVPDAVHRVRNWDEVLSFFRAQDVLPPTKFDRAAVPGS